MSHRILERRDGIKRPDQQEAMFTVRMRANGLQHVVEDHIHMRSKKRPQQHNRQPEPWHSIVPGQLLVELRACLKTEYLSDDSRRQFLDILWQELESASQKPVGLNLFVRRNGEKWVERWLFVLPSGSVVILQRHNEPDGKREEEVVTWFFHQVACGSPNAQGRCLETIRKYATRYCLATDGWLKLPATQTVEVNSSGRNEQHSGFDFYSEKNWGFDGDGRWKSEDIPEYGHPESEDTEFSTGNTLQIAEGE